MPIQQLQKEGTEVVVDHGRLALCLKMRRVGSLHQESLKRAGYLDVEVGRARVIDLVNELAIDVGSIRERVWHNAMRGERRNAMRIELGRTVLQEVVQLRLSDVRDGEGEGEGTRLAVCRKLPCPPQDGAAKA